MIKKIIIYYYYLKYRRIDKKSKNKDWLKKYKENKKKRYIKWLIKNSKFYKNYSINKGLDQFPIMDKKCMMENFNNLNTVGLKKEDIFEIAFKAEKTRDFSQKIDGITIGLSSGTSGNRGIFLASFMEECKWCGMILSKTFSEGLFKKERIAFFLRANSNLYENINGFKIKFNFFDLFEDLNIQIEKMIKFNPTVIVAPAKVLLEIGKKYENLSLKTELKRVYSVAEVLEKRDKKRLEEQFKVDIYEIYQATEGFLGISCKENKIHLNEESLIIEKEWIDEKRFYPIITDLERKSQPIVRYRLNDILHISECNCEKNTIVIENIEGREDDIFIMYDRETGEERKIFPDFIRRKILLSDNNILEYQVIQKKERIEIYLEIDRDDKNRVYKAVESNFKELFEEFRVKEIELFFKDKILLRADEKLRRIKREIF